MPIALPGLFDFTRGRSLAIDQGIGRANADAARASSFVAQLNAFNTGLSTNDNLEFRRGFAEQPVGTPILDRFSNFSQSTTNPFALNQAVLQQQSLAPLLAQNALQNPFFAQQQGIPGTAQGALDQGFLGFNPIFQQQFNQQLPQVLAQGNPGPNPQQLASTLVAAERQGIANNGAAAGQQQSARLMGEIEALRRLLAQTRSSVPSTPTNGVNTAATPAISLQSSLPLSRPGGF